MPQSVTLDYHGDVAIIRIENPPVNALGQAVRDGLIAALDTAQASSAVAIVLTGGGRAFSGGADIREFGKPLEAPDLSVVIARFEASAKPVVAAIHGVALGGGLELALGCGYRVASADAQVGLPEVKLGLLPGAGGTQRLPRLIGPAAAVAMMTSGDPINAAAAKTAGIVDAIIEGDLIDGAAAFALSAVGKKPPLVRDRSDKIAGADIGGLAKIRADLAKKARNLVSPSKIVDAVEAACTLSFDEGLVRERQLFAECMASPQSRGLIHAFFAEREASKIPDIPDATPTRPIKQVAIIGAGTMGGGIAMNFANAGMSVALIEVDNAALERGVERIRGNYAGTVSKGRLTETAMNERMALLHPTTDFARVADADLIIEAAFERMDVKLDIFRRLDKLAKPGAILATNTSSLDVDEIAAATGRPADVLGLHFFSPANVMRLLEVVRGKATARDVLATVMEVSRKIKKIAVVVGVCDGFVGNRMLAPYAREAEFLVAEGATPGEVDAALLQFGMAMGPFAMLDMAGLDVHSAVLKQRAHRRAADARHSQIIEHLVEAGRFGQKTGAGWYRYEPGKRVPLPDPGIEHFFAEEAQRLSIERRPISADEIVKRCLYGLVNEGAKILDEGMALRGGDIDVIYVSGYGFPAFRGGPMFWADTVGLTNILADIERFHKAHGDFWKPSPLLVRLAKEGKSLAAYKAGDAS